MDEGRARGLAVGPVAVLLQTFGQGVLAFEVGVAPAFAILIAAEAFFLRDTSYKIPIRSRLTALAFWTAFAPFAVGTNLLFAVIFSHVTIKPLFSTLNLPFLPKPASVMLGAICAAIIGDFFYYWCHRAQHRFLWRFHAVHHSVREMSGVATYHHVSETAFKIILYGLPLSLFIQDPFGIPILGGLLGLHGHYLHSPIRFNFGPFGRILQDNRFHRIHHSIHPEHYDKNFGVFTTFWDWLFGTAYFPAADEWPDTGVVGAPEPQTIRDYLLMPFRPHLSGVAVSSFAHSSSRLDRH